MDRIGHSMCGILCVLVYMRGMLVGCVNVWCRLIACNGRVMCVVAGIVAVV